MDYKTQTAWKRENTRLFSIRLNKNTDNELIERIEKVAKAEGVQGYLKRLVREDLRSDK